MSQTMQICVNGKDHKAKTKKKRKKEIKQREKQKFLALGDLVRSSKKVFIEGNQLVSGSLVSSPDLLLLC